LGAHTTTGKVKVGLAFEPDVYELLKELAPGPRALGAMLADLIRAEAVRRATLAGQGETPPEPDSYATPAQSSSLPERTEAEPRQAEAQAEIGRLYEAAQREIVERDKEQARQWLETLQAANAALSGSLDLDAVLETLLDHLGALIPYDSANVMLRTNDTTVAVWARRGYEHWTDATSIKVVSFDIARNSAIREVFSSQRSLVVPDTARYDGWESRTGPSTCEVGWQCHWW
jgi:hypothetical protein